MNQLTLIDEKVNGAIAERVGRNLLTSEDHAAAKRAATRRTAGFEFIQPELLDTALDKLVEARTAQIAAFQVDRSKARELLSTAGIVPLAIIPSMVWRELCVSADLYRLYPDAQNRVVVRNIDLDVLPRVARPRTRSNIEEDRMRLDSWADANRAEVLALLFGDSRRGDRPDPQKNQLLATISLPQPPADVAMILEKAIKAKLQLAVAAEPAAVQLAQRLSDVLRSKLDAFRAEAERARLEAERAEAARRAQSVDPIVYVEVGNATAILAQFGEFPIEQALVDTVIKGDDLIPDGPITLSAARYNNITDLYQKLAS